MNIDLAEPAPENDDGDSALEFARSQALLLARQAQHMAWSNEESPPVAIGVHGALISFGLVSDQSAVMVTVSEQDPLNSRGLDRAMLIALAGTLLGVADALAPYQPDANRGTVQ